MFTQFVQVCSATLNVLAQFLQAHLYLRFYVQFCAYQTLTFVHICGGGCGFMPHLLPMYGLKTLCFAYLPPVLGVGAVGCEDVRDPAFRRAWAAPSAEPTVLVAAGPRGAARGRAWHRPCNCLRFMDRELELSSFG